MALDTKARLSMNASGVAAKEIDEGLRRYMLSVYNYMASGVILTGILAYVTANSAFMLNLLYTQSADGRFGPSMLGFVVMFAPLAFILVISFGINKLSAAATQAVFWAFCAVMGLSLSSIFLQYTGVSIARVFFITSATFGAMSLYGYTTKRDLTGMGSFLMMGLIGIIIASVVNMFMQSSVMQFAISVIGVLIFVGLTAYDTQKIRRMYLAADSHETMSKKAIMGALTLYLDFINLMLMLLHLFGNRR